MDIVENTGASDGEYSQSRFESGGWSNLQAVFLVAIVMVLTATRAKETTTACLPPNGTHARPFVGCLPACFVAGRTCSSVAVEEFIPIPLSGADIPTFLQVLLVKIYFTNLILFLNLFRHNLSAHFIFGGPESFGLY